MARSQETIDLLLTRRSVKALTMVEPGPDEKELEIILRAASRVPDHGKLAPWRFVLFRSDAREAFGKELAKIYAKANPAATADQIEFESKRFTRSPLVIAVVSRVTSGIKIPEWEQVLSAGAVCQNMLIAAAALGYGGQWLTEWYAFDDEARALLNLQDGERVAGFIYIGSPSIPNDERPRPDLSEIVSDWTA